MMASAPRRRIIPPLCHARSGVSLLRISDRIQCVHALSYNLSRRATAGSSAFADENAHDDGDEDGLRPLFWRRRVGALGRRGPTGGALTDSAICCTVVVYLRSGPIKRPDAVCSWHGASASSWRCDV